MSTRCASSCFAICCALVIAGAFFSSCLPSGEDHSSSPAPAAWDPFLDTLQTRTLQWFLDVTPPATGLTPDRWPTPAPASIAAVGFALTSYGIACERGLVDRSVAAHRTLRTLSFLSSLPQTRAQRSAGYNGFFYHFLDSTGRREWNCELSTIDTGLLFAGIIFSQSYFDKETAVEDSIRRIADSLYRRIDWMWFTGGRRGLATSWSPEGGFGEHAWTGYNEAMIMYILALGSPTHPIPDWHMHDWYATYRWAEYYGHPHVNFGPLFGHQYSHCWIDFRGIRDRYMWGKGIDYFENSRRATYAQQAYGIDNPQEFRDYSGTIWGWTACDGPGDIAFVVDGKYRAFWSYRAREASFTWVDDDGTIAPTAAGGSVAFAPDICIPALKAMRDRGTPLWSDYGFRDSFNPTFRTPETGPSGWVARDYLGIDQGPIAIMIENLRDDFVWNTMKRNPYILAGLLKMGFSGGWLNAPPVVHP